MKKIFLSLALLISSISFVSAENEPTKPLNNIASVDVTFSDILGGLKEITIPINKLDSALENDMFFDGSSILGYSEISESDLRLKIDPTTFSLSPWKTDNRSSVRVFCDICDTDGSSYKNDPRAILKKTLKEAEELGYSCFCGIELEFFLFKKDIENNCIVPSDTDGYCQVETDVSKKLFKEKLLNTLLEANIDVEKIHHEVACGQLEVVLAYKDPLVMAEKLLLTKLITTMCAQENGYIATFMPKPIAGVNGTGMHIHASMKKDGKNAFFDLEKQCYLSDDARHFVSGLLKRVPEINILFNSEVNSYKRLVPGYEAPIYLCCGEKNRSAAIRIPEVTREMLEKNNGAAVRIELRWGDPECNPYLAFASLFKAGIEGIKNQESHLPFIKENLYHVEQSFLDEYSITTIPESLEHALALFEESSFAKELLGESLHSNYIATKKSEWQNFLTETIEYDPFIISLWEIEKGFPTL